MSKDTSSLTYVKEARKLIEDALADLRKTDTLHITESNSIRKPRYAAVDYETFYNSIAAIRRATVKLAKAEGQTGVTVE